MYVKVTTFVTISFNNNRFYDESDRQMLDILPKR